MSIFFLETPLLLNDPLEKDKLEEHIRCHLNVHDVDRYPIQLFPHELENSYYAFVEDIASLDLLADTDTFTHVVSEECPRRTVWINPPTITDEQGNKQLYWKLDYHYIEYFQLFIKNRVYTIKCMALFEHLELCNSTPLAIARYDHLKRVREEREEREEVNQVE